MQVNVNGEWQEIAGLEKVGKTGLYPVSATSISICRATEPCPCTRMRRARRASTRCSALPAHRPGQEFGFNPADVSTLPPALAAARPAFADIEREAGEVNASFAGPASA